jgi:YgiT-type zinc finger domain-containing protein
MELAVRAEPSLCPYCGGEQIEERRIRYIYSRNEKYILVPKFPADVCLTCGMVFYHGDALLNVEQRFKAIHQKRSGLIVIPPCR